ncbi:MAG: hypothetical protein HYZ81_00225 [Nitrospinae bacterium]|nr:hypothetical protein [Nitrospinota bacterium]
MRSDLEELLGIAQQAAQAAAAVHRSADHSCLRVSMKSSAMDLVTVVDREAERQLVSAIRTARPHDAILAEEGTTLSGSSGVCWILDPLDGTTNFVYGYPAHAVAVGVERDGKRVLGAAGVLDGFYESGLGKWDIAAGAAIAEAAGAQVVELESPILPHPVLVVANANLLKALVRVLVEAGAATEPLPTTA